jgi:hypothetical protein
LNKSSSSSPAASKSIHTHNKNDNAADDTVTINERINLTKNQYEILSMICKSYDKSISEYMQQALIEAMRFDIEEGNFSDALLEKIGGNDKKKDDNSCTPSSSGSLFPGPTTQELDLLRKLQTQV